MRSDRLRAEAASCHQDLAGADQFGDAAPGPGTCRIAFFAVITSEKVSNGGSMEAVAAFEDFGHGGDVAEIDGQGFVADLFRARFGKPEVNSFDQHVGRQQDRVPVSQIQGRRVVPDPDRQPGVRLDVSADPIDQRELVVTG